MPAPGVRKWDPYDEWIRLTYRLGLTVREIAEMLGIPTGSTSRRLKELGLPTAAATTKGWTREAKAVYRFWCGRSVDRTPNKQGYIVVDGTTEHKIVWMIAHGPFDESTFSIHHINGIKDDNRLENLELWPKCSHREGQRPEDAVAYARLVLQTLEPLGY